MATDFKSAKQGLKYYKGALTKATGEFGEAVKNLSKEKDNATVTLSRKIRLSATVMEKLETLGLKIKKMEEVKDATVEIILGIDEKELSKSREEHIGEIEKEFDRAIEEIRELESNSEAMIAAAEEFLQGRANNSAQPVPAVQTGPVSEMFRPQNNLKPEYLDKASSHLQVIKFIQCAEIYITTGFTSSPPAQGTWSYLAPLMHMTWSFAMEKAGAKEKVL